MILVDFERFKGKGIEVDFVGFFELCRKKEGIGFK